jgi:hypothetical protein
MLKNGKANRGPAVHGVFWPQRISAPALESLMDETLDTNWLIFVNIIDSRMASVCYSSSAYPNVFI